MSQLSPIQEVSQENFAQLVIEASQEQPILVDFWADWCEPCKQLAPVLEKLAEEYAGAFILAKINVDQSQQLAAQLAVRSLPTVKLISKGQMVDEFVGVLSEPEVRAFLARHVQMRPAAATDAGLIEQAKQLLAAGDTDQAQQLVSSAMAQDADSLEARLAAFEVALHAKDYAGARQLFEGLGEPQRDDVRVQRCLSLLDLADLMTPDQKIDTLQARVQDNLADDQERYQFALLSLVHGTDDREQVLKLLLDLKFNSASLGEQAGKALLGAFDVIEDEALVSQYRHQLFAMLY